MIKAPFIFALVAIALAGCGGPSAKSPEQTRALARSAVDVAKDAWVLVAHACIDVAEQQNDDSIRVRCADYLRPAHQLIVSAADAVDTQWTGPAACELVRAAVLVGEATAGLGPVTAGIKPVVDDAVLIARSLTTGVCSAEGGAQ